MELNLLEKDWKSYFKATKEYKKNSSKFLGKPKIPSYSKHDGNLLPKVAIYDSQAISEISLDKGQVKLSQSTIEFKSPVVRKSNKYPNKYRINQVRIVPKLNYFVIEVIYTRPKIKADFDYNRFASIDLGINNIVALLFYGTVDPILFNGRKLKSINRWFNKRVSAFAVRPVTLNVVTN